jgi:hypothetical protein
MLISEKDKDCEVGQAYLAHDKTTDTFILYFAEGDEAKATTLVDAMLEMDESSIEEMKKSPNWMDKKFAKRLEQYRRSLDEQS